MSREINHDPDKKRVLKKVRRYYLNKKPEDTLVDPATKYLADNNGHILHIASGLVEVNHKICLGPHHLNPFFSFTCSLGEDVLSKKVITLNLEPVQEAAPLPWDYTLKRLESYGDLNIATWASRVNSYYQNYPRVLEEYERLVHQKDPQVLEMIKKAKERALEMCHQIESKYSYYKVIHTLTKGAHRLSSFTYSEGLLDEMGYSQEEFLEKIRENGLPAIFDTNCVVYLHIVKNLLECSLISYDLVNFGDEYETLIYNNRGTRHRVLVQLIHVFEPTHKGFILYSYFVLKNRKCGEKKAKIDAVSVENRGSDKGFKSIKEDDFETDTCNTDSDMVDSQARIEAENTYMP